MSATRLPFRVLRHGGYETAAMLRNGEQLVLAIALPVLALTAIALTPLFDVLGAPRLESGTPGVIALCVLSTAFTGQGIATGFDRRYGVLRFLSTTPLGRGGLILGKVVAVGAVLVIQLAVIGTAAVLFGWQPAMEGILPALVMLIPGIAAFTALGLLIAGTLRPEATLAVTNLLWILLAAAGGTVIPRSSLPEAAQPLVGLLPSSALGDGLRAALQTGTFDPASFALLCGWAAVAGLAAVRWFKWS
ncbi:ABC-2 type transport system permease protein [Arthrobacter pigmenti]|uniref:ABC-2 type transport system permease protein n=1 Tax=Arthrobacter pigmenti TaxID=271432 RepID=A0A846RPL0_9MICC|nr:ABC transporter permease [Arthrobacter pigmenti]NJC22314.1 ABC-2 type transport system permease protein [Arthrobacter pigmenti]